MVRIRSEGRSKGCDRCRKRKIKCDGQSPTCGYCSKIGKECSGAAIGGVVFLHASSKSELSRTRKLVHEREEKATKEAGREKDTSRSLVSSQSARVDQSSSHQETATSATQRPSKSLQKRQNSTANARQPFTPLDELQSLIATANTKQWTSHYLIICTTSGITWPLTLPSVNTPNTPPSNALLSCALAQHGHLTKNQTFTAEAYKRHGLNLSKQRSLIMGSKGGERGKKGPSTEEICVSIIFAYFEIVVSVDPDAFFMHAIAASNMMEMRGPEECGGEELFPIFIALRCTMAYVANKLRRPSIFASEEWLTIPFYGKTKTHLMRIFDVFTLTPRLLFRVDNLKSSNDFAREKELLKLEVMQLRRVVAGIAVDIDREGITSGGQLELEGEIGRLIAEIMIGTADELLLLVSWQIGYIPEEQRREKFKTSQHRAEGYIRGGVKEEISGEVDIPVLMTRNGKGIVNVDKDVREKVWDIAGKWRSMLGTCELFKGLVAGMRGSGNDC